MNKPKSNKTYIISLCITVIVYTTISNVILNVTGSSQVGMLGFIPVILFAWIYGLKRGVVAAVIILLGNTLSFTILAPPSFIVYPLTPIIGSISHLIMAIIVGSLSELVRKLRYEIASRKKAEAELHKYKEHLEKLVQERTSELERAHENLRQAEKMEAMGHLTGGIVHDFNNMLSGIIGFADLIKRKYTKNDPTLERYTNMIFDTSDRAAELISKLLIFSRKGDIQVEPLNIQDLISNTIKLLEHSIEKNIKISHDFNADSFIVMGDYAQLQNVIINLSVNARDAMPDGGTLTFSSEIVFIDEKYTTSHPQRLTPGSYIMISVSDTGIGMDEQTKIKIFEPFFTTKAPGKGTGMGLATAYGTIKSHNGSIEVYSEAGKGTTFKIYLPLADEKDHRLKETQTLIIKGSGSVLLVDDEDVMRKVGTEMLIDLGYSVATCEDGQEGVDYYRENYKTIDFVILDIMMPNLDGYSCLRELRTINPTACVIIASGYSIDSLTKNLMNEGAKAFIQKPFDMIRLSKAIEKAKIP